MGKSKCIEKIGSVQIFQQEDGSYDAFDFATGKYIPDPYKDKPPGYKPVVIKKSQEQIDAELEEIQTYPVLDLPERKLRKESLDYFNVRIGVSEEDGKTPKVHYYPYYREGSLISYKVRIIEDKRMWVVGSFKDVNFFGWEQAIATGGKRLYITEGEVDCVSLYQIFKDQNKGTQYADFNPAVVSLPNGCGGAVNFITKKLKEIKEHFKEIVLVFDMDEPGKKAAEECIKLIPECIVASLPSKDVNDCLVEGRSKACYNAVQFNAKRPKNSRLVLGSEVAAAARKEAEWGFSYPFKQLTDLTRGQRLGETVYWGAGVKMGKSELLNKLVAHNIIEHGWKCFVAKTEEANARTLQGIVGKVANRIFHDPKIAFDYEAFDSYLPEVQDNLILLNLYQELTWDILKEDIRAAAAMGVKAVYIDPITTLVNGINAADANTMLQKVAQESAQLAMDLQVIVHLFCHLRAPDNGAPHERGGAVQSHQFAGSRGMMRSCHAMLGLEGNKDPDLPEDQRNIRSIVLLEDRQSGASGKVPLFYDSKTGAFNEIAVR
jgi:twinkle protein